MVTCQDTDVLLHALIDGELDGARAREVEAHAADCRRCAAALRDFREMRRAMAGADLGFAAPAALRERIDAVIPKPAGHPPRPTRRSLLRGFALGTALSAVAATGVMIMVTRDGRDDRILDDAVTAHLRSLHGTRLTDVAANDRAIVKPWFSGKLAIAPPVIDLTAQGFTLLGGRLDHLEGRAVAAIVYRRGEHVINLFVTAAADNRHVAVRSANVQGLNTERWSDRGYRFIAVSDIDADELQTFHKTFEGALSRAT